MSDTFQIDRLGYKPRDLSGFDQMVECNWHPDSDTIGEIISEYIREAARAQKPLWTMEMTERVVEETMRAVADLASRRLSPAAVADDLQLIFVFHGLVL